MILWQPNGESLQGNSAFIKHCMYRITPIPKLNQFQIKQYWTGKHTQILLKSTRADSLEGAKQHCNEWDATYAR